MDTFADEISSLSNRDWVMDSWSPELKEYYRIWHDSAIDAGLSDDEAKEYAFGMTEGALKLM